MTSNTEKFQCKASKVGSPFAAKIFVKVRTKVVCMRTSSIGQKTDK